MESSIKNLLIVFLISNIFSNILTARVKIRYKKYPFIALSLSQSLVALTKTNIAILIFYNFFLRVVITTQTTYQLGFEPALGDLHALKISQASLGLWRPIIHFGFGTLDLWLFFTNFRASIVALNKKNLSKKLWMLQRLLAFTCFRKLTMFSQATGTIVFATIP